MRSSLHGGFSSWRNMDLAFSVKHLWRGRFQWPLSNTGSCPSQVEVLPCQTGQGWHRVLNELGVGNLRVLPIFHHTEVGCNLGLTWKVPVLSIHWKSKYTLNSSEGFCLGNWLAYYGCIEIWRDAFGLSIMSFVFASIVCARHWL